MKKRIEKPGEKKGKKSGFKWFMLFIVIILAVLFFINKSLDETETETEETQTPDEEIEGANYVEALGEIDDNSIGELYAAGRGLLINREQEILFFIKANISKDKAISLYENGEIIGTMNDDGVDGDEKKDDDIYSYRVALCPQSYDDISFYAEFEDQKSNDVVLRVYDEPTEDEINDANDLMKQLKSIEEAASVDGYVPEDMYSDVIDELYNSAQEIADEKGIGIESITKSSNGITIIYDTGMIYNYSLKKEGVLEGGDEAYLTVVTVEPYPSLPSLSSQAQKIESTIDGASYSKAYSYESVTLETIQEAFQPNSFIIWLGHGGYFNNDLSGNELSWLGTEQLYTDDIKSRYATDVACGSFGFTEEGYILINYNFFHNHISDLSNSFVYLCACYSAKDNMLMNAMRNKGAEAVVGYTDRTNITYGVNICKETINKLCTVYTTGDNYYTIYNSLESAKEIHGENDGDSTPAEPILIGNLNYRINDCIPKKVKLIDDFSKLPDIENPIDIDEIKEETEQKIDDTVNQVTESLLDRLQKEINKWFMENCGNC